MGLSGLTPGMFNLLARRRSLILYPVGLTFVIIVFLMMLAGIAVAVWYSCIAPIRLRHRQVSLQQQRSPYDSEKYSPTIAPLFMRDPGSPDSLYDDKTTLTPDLGHEALTPQHSPTTTSGLSKLDGTSTPTIALLFKQSSDLDLASSLRVPEPAHNFDGRIRFSLPQDGREAVWWFY